MKRVANKIAVQSLVYTVGGNQLLRIVDYPSQAVFYGGGEGVTAFDDNACGIHSYKYERLKRAEVLKTSIEVNKAGHPILILAVSTNDEEY